MKPSIPIQIVFEDKHIIVCLKPPGIATQTKSHTQRDVTDYLKQHLFTTSQSDGEPYLGVIHRLDQPVSGLLVFAKTPVAARGLSQQLTNKGFGKHYKALIKRSSVTSSDTLIHHLKKDGRTNTSSVCSSDDKEGKIAILHYRFQDNIKTEDLALFDAFTLTSIDDYQLIVITLDTGRHHQIRVQMSHIGCPILGDDKYGSPTPKRHSKAIALCAYKLEFSHPITKKMLTFELPLSQ